MIRPTLAPSISRFLRQYKTLPSVSRIIITRSLVSRAPGSDPLDLLRHECMSRQLCDQNGNRLPGVHWVCAIAVSAPDIAAVSFAYATVVVLLLSFNSHFHVYRWNLQNFLQPPNLRTVGIQRLSHAGIDFILKATSPTAKQLATGQGIAFLHTQGHFLPGESAEQWRGEGTCHTLSLDDKDLVSILPHHTLISMIGSLRLERENAKAANKNINLVSERARVDSKSHMTEVMQRTRMELENGDVSQEELNASVQAFRFKPDRLECMFGGPDSVMWDRWEWLRDKTESTEGALQWNDAQHLHPH